MHSVGLFWNDLFLASYYLSCDMHKMYTSDENEERTYIDPDGSGPLDPFQVFCSGKGNNQFICV
jgi:hypothetical protein